MSKSMLDILRKRKLKKGFNPSYYEMRRKAILRKSEVKRYIIRGLEPEKTKKKKKL